MWLRKSRLIWQKKSIKTSVFYCRVCFAEDELESRLNRICHFHFLFDASWNRVLCFFRFLELFLQIAFPLATFTRLVPVLAKGLGNLLFLDLIIGYQKCPCHTLEKYDK